MISKVTFFIAALLVAGNKAQTDKEGCSQEEIFECLDPMLEAMKREVDLDEACGVIELTYGCITGKAELCLTEAEQAEIQDDLKPIENILEKHCTDKENTEITSEDIDDIEDAVECAEDNEDYLMGCLEETNYDFSKFVGASEEEATCIAAGMIIDCISERAAERCGLTAGILINAGIKAEIEDTCPNLKK